MLNTYKTPHEQCFVSYLINIVLENLKEFILINFFVLFWIKKNNNKKILINIHTQKLNLD